MAGSNRDKGTGAGQPARIKDPFLDDPLSFPHSPGASSTEASPPETGRGFQTQSTKFHPEEEIGTREESFTSAASHPVDPLGGLRTSLDNLNVSEASASPRTPTLRVLGGEDEEPRTPPEKILREGRAREAPGAPKKPRRPSGFDKEAMARVTKKLEFE